MAAVSRGGWSEDRGGLAWQGWVFLQAGWLERRPLRSLRESLVPGSEPSHGSGANWSLTASSPFFVPCFKICIEHLPCAQLCAGHRDQSKEQESSDRKP